MSASNGASTTVGVLPAPSGVIANPVDPVNPYSTVWITGNLVCLVVPSVLVLLRLYIRQFLMGSLTLVDCKCLTVLRIPRFYSDT